MIKKISISVILLASLLFINVGCDDHLDVNTDEDTPSYVNGYLYLAGITQAYQEIYYDIRATGLLTQMMGTPSKNSSFVNYAEQYYPIGSDNGAMTWRMVYWTQGINLENMINQSVEAEDWTLAGIGYAIKAYSWDLLTKYHSELPLEDAFVYGLMSHDYDYQEDIYPKVREWAYKAIEYLQKEDTHQYWTNISANDYIYGGDKAKWIKFSYGVIVRNLASLSNKSNFTTDYAQELISCAEKSLQSSADDATVKVEGGSDKATYAAYNNFWGTNRTNLAASSTTYYYQHEYAVQVFTGTVPKYNESDGEKYTASNNTYCPYELAEKQIICDTLVSQTGHFDPRVSVKLATTDDPYYKYIDNIALIKSRKYYGGSFSSTNGPIGTAPSFYGRNDKSAYSGTPNDGKGRWLYRDDAPYILMTCAEINFCLAETYWKLGSKSEAFEAFKKGVKSDLEFTAKYIYSGSKGNATGGDKITTTIFNTLASEYSAGPYVDGLSLSDFSLSHIMMQKWVALYPWGANEAWVDMRKYHYDIDYSGEYPSLGNGWTTTSVEQKWDSDDSKVFKGLYLAPAQVKNRKSTYNTKNEGSPCYRVRPRYNSEYMWNLPSLGSLVPISGTADNYQCSIPWFAYPGDIPTSN